MPLSLEIVLPQISDDTLFEKMCKYILEAAYSSRFSLYGRSGQKQFGIDIRSDNPICNDGYVVAQCKNYITSKAADVISAIKDDIEKATELPGDYKKYIVMTAFHRDRLIQDYIQEQQTTLAISGKEIEIWFWDDIQDFLLVHDSILSIFYPGLLRASTTALPHWLTKPIPYTDESNILLRRDEINNAIKSLNEHRFINLTGFGGIGKTSIAKVIIHRLKDSFSHIAWINYLGDLEKSIESECVLYEDEVDSNTRKEKIFTALRNSETKTLFVIDNVDSNNEIKQNPLDDSYLTEIMGWDNTYVIITSRIAEIKGYYSFLIDFLNEDACVNVFSHYARSGICEGNESVIRKIIQAANCHTLTVEILAKSTKYISNLNTYYQTLIEKGFKGINLNIQTNHSNIVADITDHLRFLFSISTRSNDELNILWTFAILPSYGLSIQESELWLKYSINDLDKLIGEGWLNFSEGIVAMHPLIQEIFIGQIDKGFPDATATGLLDWYAANIITTSSTTYEEANRVLDIAECVMKYFTNKSGSYWGDIYLNLGMAFSNRCKLKSSLKYYRLAANIFIDLYNKVPHKWAPKLEICMNNMAGIYVDEFKDYKKAEAIYRDALDIGRNLVKIYANSYYKNSLAGTYINIANILSRRIYAEQKGIKCDEYIEANNYYAEATHIIESISSERPDKYDISLAVALDNWAILISLDESQSNKAIELRKRAVALLEKWKHLEDCKEHYIKTTKNLAVAMFENDEPISEIVELYKAAYAICIEMVEKNPELYGTDLADIYLDLGKILILVEQYQEGISFLSEAKLWYEKNEHTPKYAINIQKVLDEIKM